VVCVYVLIKPPVSIRGHKSVMKEALPVKGSSLRQEYHQGSQESVKPSAVVNTLLEAADKSEGCLSSCLFYATWPMHCGQP